MNATIEATAARIEGIAFDSPLLITELIDLRKF